MSLKNVVSASLHHLRVSLVSLVVFQLSLGGVFAVPMQAGQKEEPSTKTPIKHVIVLIGENRTFDHLFATYKPKHGESVKNLLSEGIINADGTPGPNFNRARQFQAIAPFRTTFYISLDSDDKAPYEILPEP